MATLTRLGRELLDLLMPSVCVVCGSRPSDPLPLCAGCAGSLVVPDPVDLRIVMRDLDPVDVATALWMLDPGGGARAVIHALKYRGLLRVGPVLGHLIARRLSGSPCPDVVVPLPLHRGRLRERGYNQAALIGRGVADGLGIPMDERTLYRVIASASQTRADRSERARAVRGAFRIRHPDRIAGRRILLVDDVLTTGATAGAAAGALVGAGAASVHLAVVGLTRPPMERIIESPLR